MVALVWLCAAYRSWRQYLAHLEGEKRRAERTAEAHLRAIEELALAIGAKGNPQHDVQRWKACALELGKRFGLAEAEMRALRIAVPLHDVGSLAVPEYILSKPGVLTPEEFDKVKIHCTVAAQILAKAEYPDPVAPVVRAHHERWDGTGYPDRLKGNQIPAGARILAVVDRLAALVSGRQYRAALPLNEALQVLDSEAGSSLDPSMVKLLVENRAEFERLLEADGAQPESGPEFVSSIAATRQEARSLYQLAEELGNSLSLHEILAELDTRLRELIRFHGIAVYLRREDRLVPEYVNGEDYGLFSSLEIPLGQGLSGWAAQTRQPVVNGDPSLEYRYLHDSARTSGLLSALVTPLGSAEEATGALALYHLEPEAFNTDDLRVLLEIVPKVSRAIQHALQYRRAQCSAGLDALTSLPNARALFLRLDAELARCRRMQESLGVLACELGGFEQAGRRFDQAVCHRALEAVAVGLGQSCREYDFIARTGDQFVLILNGFARRDLPEKLKLLENLADQAALAVFGEHLLTLNAGAAFYSEDGPDAESLLAQADRRLYAAKFRRSSGVM
jgi:diguanylate cyclase (GGDEF)-like protein